MGLPKFDVGQKLTRRVPSIDIETQTQVSITIVLDLPACLVLRVRIRRYRGEPTLLSNSVWRNNTVYLDLPNSGLSTLSYICRREDGNCSHQKQIIGSLITLAFLLASASAAFAQVTVSGTSAITNIPRAGVNIGASSYWSSQSQANFFANPGFEWPQFAQVISVATATSRSFTATNKVNWPEPTNFWNGTNNCSVRVGTCSDGSNNYCWNNTATTVAQGGCKNGGTCNAGVVFGISGYSATGSDSSGREQTFTCSGRCPTLAAPSVATSSVLRFLKLVVVAATARAMGWLSGSVVHHPDNSPADEIADIVGCRVVVTNPGFWPKLTTNFGNWTGGGWGTHDPKNIFVTAAKAYLGNSSLEVNAASATVSFSYLWDNGNAPNPSVCLAYPQDICIKNSDCPDGDTCQLSGNGPFVNHPIYGSRWLFSFYALTSSSRASCSATLGRDGGSTDFVNERFNIGSKSGGDGQWHQYTYSFIGRDRPSNLGSLNFSMSCSNGLVYFDNLFLGQTNAISGFTHDTYESLLGLNPGTIRMAPTDVSGGVPTAAQLDGTSYVMPPMGQLESLGIDGTAFSYGEMIGLAAALSSTTSPWLTVGMAWPDNDYHTFGSQLCKWEGTYNFPAIYVECNNENWNGGEGLYFKTPMSPAYGLACARAFDQTSSKCNDSRIHYLFNNQTGNSGVMAAVQDNYDFPNSSQYGISNHFYIDSGSSSTSLSSIVAAAFSNTMITRAVGKDNQYDDVGQLCQGKYGSDSGCNQIVAWYEGGPQTYGTSGNYLAASQANVGWASAGIEMQALLQMLSGPNVAQAGDITNTFVLSQSGNGSADMWGVTPGNWGVSSAFAPVYPWYRPAGLAIQLYNRAVRGDYHACIGMPSDIYCAAFLSGGKWTAALTNGNSATTSMTIAFPAGTVPSVGVTINYAKAISDNNEATNTVTIGRLKGGVSIKGQVVSFTMPAFSAVALLGGDAPLVNSPK